MSLSMRDLENEIETAAGRVDVAATTTEENALSFEASEDRIVYGIIAKAGGTTTVEVSFSSQMLTDTEPVSDEVSSGVLWINNGSNISTWTEFGVNGPHWSAGEELNVHVDNASASTQVIVLAIAYIPIGDFLRERLRNR